LKGLYQTQVLGVFIYSKLTREVLQQMPCLKLIVTMSTGYDHIDLAYCKREGIRVCNVPKYGGACVAEHTFALILALTRHLDKAIENTRHDDFSIDELMGVNLHGKTMGVVGVGTIGQHVIEIAKAFGMNVLATTDRIRKGFHNGLQYVSLNELLRKSDLVTFHVPLTKKTFHMINRKNIRLMKRGSYLINTSRGGIVETQAVVGALESKRLAGAAFDVLEGEGTLREAHQPLRKEHFDAFDWHLLRKNHALLKRKNVIITPHIAFYTKESIKGILDTTIQNIKSFEKGKPQNFVI
jgi:D-lactate dehydrogenase